MRGYLLGSGRRRLGVAVGVLALLPASLASAQVGFPEKGAFEACLEQAVAAWVRTQAELVVNEDPRAQALDDTTVAGWSVSAITDCRTKAGSGEAASEGRFTSYMSRWREHVFNLASSIRQRAISD
jgi:hypothetical protein